MSPKGSALTYSSLKCPNSMNLSSIQQEQSTILTVFSKRSIYRKESVIPSIAKIALF